MLRSIKRKKTKLFFSKKSTIFKEHGYSIDWLRRRISIYSIEEMEKEYLNVWKCDDGKTCS